MSDKTPHEVLFEKPPNFYHLKTFGCLCYAAMIPWQRKFEPRARQCVFLGYSHGIKSYKLYNLKTHQVFYSRDVTFYESIFPFHDLSISTTLDSLPNYDLNSNPLYDYDTDVGINDTPILKDEAPNPELRCSTRHTQVPAYL